MTASVSKARPLTGRRRPCTWTTDGATAATASAIASEKLERGDVLMDAVSQEGEARRITRTGGRGCRARVRSTTSDQPRASWRVGTARTGRSQRQSTRYAIEPGR